MAYFQKDEMAIVKAVSIKLDDDIALIATMQYHTEKGNRAASRYRWLARVIRISEAHQKITELMQDSNRLGPWKWPDDPSWDGKMYTKDSTAYVQARWLRMKLQKLVDWETGVKLLGGWNKKSDEYNLKAKYDTEGYTSTDGSTVSLLDKDTLITKVNQNLLKEIQMKCKKIAPVEQPQESEEPQPQENQPQEVIPDPSSAPAA